MCGRYYADREFIPKLSVLFGEEQITVDPELEKEWDTLYGSGSADIKPADKAVTIIRTDDGLTAGKMKWGMRDPYHGSLLINARAETAYRKQMFSESMRKRRCLIPASGYYEWDPAKTKYSFCLPGGELVLLAGCYHMELGEPHYTILTTEANDCMLPVHPRMPVMVSRNEIGLWLTDNAAAEEILTRPQQELERIQGYGQISMDFLQR